MESMDLAQRVVKDNAHRQSRRMSNSSVFSRAYLQSLPEGQKEQFVQQLFFEMQEGVKAKAKIGQTNYFHKFSDFGNTLGLPSLYFLVRSKIFNLQSLSPNNFLSHFETQQKQIEKELEKSLKTSMMAREECLERLQTNHFPDCKVSYEERWVDAQTPYTPNQKTQVLEKGILIDWS